MLFINNSDIKAAKKKAEKRSNNENGSHRTYFHKEKTYQVCVCVHVLVFFSV